MKKKIIVICVLSAFALGLSACNDKADVLTPTDERQVGTIVNENVGVSDETQETDQRAASVEDDTSTIPQKEETQNEIPRIGGSDYAFSRKYIDKVYDIYLASQIVGQEAREEWVNNVFLAKSPSEQVEIPPLYQMIHDLNISKEDFIAKNAENIDTPGMYFSDDIISALYLDDIEEMKKQLANPLALYYEGEIYTFDELSQSQNTRMTANIPADVMSNYLGYIELVCEENGIIKYMQEDIDRVQNTYQLAVEQDEINSESDVTDFDSTETDFEENEMPDYNDTETDFEENEVPDFEDNSTGGFDDEIPFSPDEN